MAKTFCKLKYNNISGTHDIAAEAITYLDQLGLSQITNPTVHWFKGKPIAVVLYVDGPESQITWATTLFNFKVIE